MDGEHPLPVKLGTRPLTQEDLDRWYEEGREARREEARRMTPLERMEEAYRLSVMMRWGK